ncbi:NAD(P)/FAD-dependent oxidoreductase [Luteimonas notoginsengisoli]|jgi:flavin-dependent dehydrogenase|uniref:NAD(P)/FAD-dependent oxidoreductase n=1 Tax=Luteimonas notoginsengisoli TaxID=1578200 RepID=A0ABV7UUT5_9GAMM
MSKQADTDTDITILGGGLAGLTLAIQLRRQDPGLRVTVLERNAHPVREAAFKVGESTVEIGAHYFAHVLGLRDHLDEAHVRKFGFRFFFSEGREDIERCTELGVSRLLPTPSWQIDRGRFENFLGLRARSLGVDFRDGATVRAIALDDGDAAHEVTFEHAGATTTLSSRWVVDASGRAGLLKRKLDLAQDNDHDANAAWWRVEGRIDPNDWSDDPQWLARCTPPDRWRSTNHMCGPGYWFWLIPLASGAHSLGIVCDGKTHPLDTMNTHEKAMAWLREHQPRVAASLEQPGHALCDFRFLRHFSHGCRQVFGNRWALTGEAGLFLDPFYSPGSDFIAISNTFICNVIARERAGQNWTSHAEIYQQLYFSFYENTMTLFQDQYALFGDTQVMPVKIIWDYTFYWALLAPMFFAGRIADIGMFGRLREQFERGSALNTAMQALLREWGKRNAGRALPLDSRVLDQYRIDWFHELNRALADQLNDDAFAARITSNVERMGWLGAEILQRARAEHAEIGDHGLDALAVGDASPPPSLSASWYASAA